MYNSSVWLEGNRIKETMSLWPGRPSEEGLDTSAVVSRAALGPVYLESLEVMELYRNTTCGD